MTVLENKNRELEQMISKQRKIYEELNRSFRRIVELEDLPTYFPDSRMILCLDSIIKESLKNREKYVLDDYLVKDGWTKESRSTKNLTYNYWIGRIGHQLMEIFNSSKTDIRNFSKLTDNQFDMEDYSRKLMSYSWKGPYFRHD